MAAWPKGVIVNERSYRILDLVRSAIASGAFIALFATTAIAQNTDVALALPDAPAVASANSRSTSSDATASVVSTSNASLSTASLTQKFIEPGQIAPPLSASDKALLGARAAFSPFAAEGWIASAGYEQLMNGSPNYGTDRGAFGQRLGASAIRDSSEGIFSDSVMANLLREDPRYYRMGSGHNFFVRLIYSGTRPIFTRTDGGRATLNLASLGGTMGGAALTNLYYPQVNRGVTQTMETFGESIGGSALGDVVSEFSRDLRHMLHHKNQ
jgi:hypothetical protein